MTTSLRPNVLIVSLLLCFALAGSALLGLAAVPHPAGSLPLTGGRYPGRAGRSGFRGPTGQRDRRPAPADRPAPLEDAGWGQQLKEILHRQGLSQGEMHNGLLIYLQLFEHRLQQLYRRFEADELSLGYFANELGLSVRDLYAALEQRGLPTSNIGARPFATTDGTDYTQYRKTCYVTLSGAKGLCSLAPRLSL